MSESRSSVRLRLRCEIRRSSSPSDGRRGYVNRERVSNVERCALHCAVVVTWLAPSRFGGATRANRVIGVGEFAVQLKVIAQSAFGRRDMLTSPCFGVLLVPPVHTTLFSVQNKQFLGHFVWDPQCLLRLRSLHVNAINPYVGYWTGASALQQLRQPVTMETRYIIVLPSETTVRRWSTSVVRSSRSFRSRPSIHYPSLRPRSYVRYNPPYVSGIRKRCAFENYPARSLSVSLSVCVPVYVCVCASRKPNKKHFITLDGYYSSSQWSTIILGTDAGWIRKC